MARFGAAGRAAVLVALVAVLGGLFATGYFVDSALAASSPAAPTITSSPSNPTTSTSATFTYSDSTSGVTFKCSHDSSSFSSCSSSGVTYTGLAEGSHTFNVEAVSGSSTSSATSYSWAIIPPTPTITSEPANPVASTSATFKYSDTLSGVSFLCSLDSSSFSSCSSSGITYDRLSDGTHTFSVKAQVGSGPASAAATHTWRVDTTAPTITLTFPAMVNIYTPSNWATGCSPTGICGTAADPSGVKSVSVGILQFSSGDYWNGKSFSSSSLVFNTATGTTSWDYPFAIPPTGIYAVFVQGTDGLGNSTPSSQYLMSLFLTDVPVSPTITMYSGSPQSATVGTSFSSPLVAQVTDDYGRPASGVSVTFTAPASGASGTFATCSGGNPTPNECVVSTNASGLANASTFTANTVAGGPYTVTATTVSVSSPANFSLTNIPGPAKKLVFITSPVSGAASSSATLGPITVQLEDAYGNPVTASGSGTVVSLGSSSTAGIFSVSSGGSTTISVTIASGKTSVSFYYGDTKADSPTITASSSPLTSASQSETITAAAASKLVFTTSPVSGAASSSATLGPITVQLEDAYGNPVTASGSGTVVKLTSTSSGGIFAATSGGIHITSITITSGNSSATFYYGDTVTGSPTITVASSPLTSATQKETITGVATKLVFLNSAQSGAASNSAQLGPITVQVENVSGSPVNVAVSTTVSLSSNSTGTYILNTNQGATSPTGATSVTIPAGSSSVTFYYGDTRAGTPTITAASSGLTSATQTQTITAGTPTIISIVSGNNQLATANNAFANPLVVQVTDAYGNLVPGASVTFTAPSSGASGTFSSSTGTISVLTGSNGQASSGTFTANTVAGGPYNVSAATSGPSPVSFALTNTPAPASKLVFTTQPSAGQNVTAGAATSFKASVEDAYGNTETSDNTTTVSLAIGVNPGGATLSCTNTNGTGPVTVANGVASFTCSLNKAGTGYTLSATSNPAHGTATSNAFNIIVGTPASIAVFSGNNQSTTQGSAFANPLVVQVTDTYGNPVSGVSVTFKAPSSGASGTFSNSTATITASTGPNGQASESFTANNTGGQYAVTVTTPGVSTPATFTLLNGENFTVSGSISTPLYPGTSQPVNLTITNPNPSPDQLTVNSSSLSVVVTPSAGCPTSYFTMNPGSWSVTVPAGVTESLSTLGVSSANLPVIKMIDTGTNQDSCEGATLNFAWSSTGNGAP
jgi:hypothetical protein